ncbi:MAG TPA: Gfo/Idh/MocA family oxidoreductase [Gammaproteobacteria bacterium]|jgi:predicted dehydrogenase
MSVKVGIIGLGRWAKVLTRAARPSGKLEIVAGFSRSEEKRRAFEAELGIAAVPDLDTLLGNPEIKGVILTVPNEQHLPVAEAVAAAGKHVYTEKPIANTLESGLKIEALVERYGVQIMVGHSARLLKGTRMIKDMIDRGELGKVAFIEANFSNERALELTPDTWRWYRDKAPGGPLSQLAIHQFDSVHYLGGEIAEVSSIASKLSPVGAEVDDQSMTTLRFADGKLAYVGSCWTSPGIYSLRVFGQKGLMHYEVDFSSWDTPDKLHETSTLYIQRGKDGYGKREELEIPPGNMFLDELEMFAEMCATGRPSELSAYNGNVALAVVYAALRSVDRNGASVAISDILDESRARISA